MSTLIRPPKVDPVKSNIENTLELTQLTDIDPNLFTNTRELWHPPGARGLYGGCVIAQSLAAAQRTVPKNFTGHSMHCYFVLAGSSEMPVIYHVEHVREGRSFATRTVQARQRGAIIFTTTISFVRENSGGKLKLEHSTTMPDVPDPVENIDDFRAPQGSQGPFQSQRIDIENNDSPEIHTKRIRQWIRARGKISESGGHEAHLSALAYMSDSYFVGTIARVHKVWRFTPPGKDGKPTVDADVLKKLLEMDDDDIRKLPGMDDELIKRIRERQRTGKWDQPDPRPEIGMMVSLDHTIFFHNPRDFRADEWMYTEMESPWTGDGRGLVIQRMFTRDGKLIATCVQEGMCRLKQPADSKL
ncbi:Thioesterase/thiol ester dehydrase-isomerase [Patellaria atrata CBS 101060]|uniref:Thioesterase/thiol ester dehydrase-isomerase n=1 Tax=Patellaria atrata CBS 101060 TaxID=1346257 RepID=A0A9P4SKM1_9PEZI|nr:Thioesterase/thiol ester dehydrase-isomerase [Patellaria atrata CBS 101060]